MQARADDWLAHRLMSRLVTAGMAPDGCADPLKVTVLHAKLVPLAMPDMVQQAVHQTPGHLECPCVSLSKQCTRQLLTLSPLTLVFTLQPAQQLLAAAGDTAHGYLHFRGMLKASECMLQLSWDNHSGKMPAHRGDSSLACLSSKQHNARIPDCGTISGHGWYICCFSISGSLNLLPEVVCQSLPAAGYCS